VLQLIFEPAIGKRTVLLNTEVREYIKGYLMSRFGGSTQDIAINNRRCDHRIYSLHLIVNQKRGYFDAWTLPCYLTKLYRSAGVNKTAASGRQTYIKKLTESGLAVPQMVRLSGVTAETITRYLMDRDDVSERAVIEGM